MAEIDLRWGVTQEESASGKAIEICLDEIDRSEIFLCLIGSRYGWIPDEYEIGDEARFEWINKDPAVQGHSITELEIMRGALNPNDSIAPKLSHALFYFRDDQSLLEDLADQPEVLSDLTDGTCHVRAGEKRFERDRMKEDKLVQLKDKIRAHSSVDNEVTVSLTENYKSLSVYNGADANEVDLSAQEVFCAQVLEDLKRAIDNLHPRTKALRGSKVSEHEIQKECESSYAEHRLLHFQARGDQVQRILDFVDCRLVKGPLLVSGETGLGKTSVVLKACQLLETRPGWTQENVIVKFIAGSSPGSCQAHNMLRSLILQLREHISAFKPRRRVDHLWSLLRTSVKVGATLTYGSKLNRIGMTHNKTRILPNELAGSFQELADFFNRTLVEACSFAKVVLVIDNLENMVRDSSHVTALQWLPQKMPKGLRLIFVANEADHGGGEEDAAVVEQKEKVGRRSASPLQSVQEFDLTAFSDQMVCGLNMGGGPLEREMSRTQDDRSEIIDDSSVLLSFRSRFKRLHDKVKIQGLARAEAERLVAALLGMYGKKLDGVQLQMLLQNPAAKNPTWLVIACEELRIFTQYEEVLRRVAELPKDVPNLLSQFIDRLERDHSAEFVRDTLSIIVCSRDGLYEREILEVLGVSQSTWSRLFYALKPFLRKASSAHGDDIIAFSQRDITLSIVLRYFDTSMALHAPADQDPSVVIHRRLAKYYKRVAMEKAESRWNPERARALWSLPYHQIHGRLFKELELTLTDLYFIEAYCKAGGGFDWVSDLGRAMEAYERTQDVDVTGYTPTTISSTPAPLLTLNLSARPKSAASVTASASMGGEAASKGNIRKRLHTAMSRHSLLSTATRSMARQSRVTKSMLNKIQDYQEFAQAYAHHLMCYPDLVFQYAANLPDTNCASMAAKELWEKERKDSNKPRRSWLRLINKPRESGPCIMELRGHSGPVLCCQFSKDGKHCVSGSADCTIRIWLAQSGETIAKLEGHTGPVSAVCFSPKNSDVIVSASHDGTARIWKKGIQNYVFKRHSQAQLTACAFSDNARLIATGDSTGALLVWSARKTDLRARLDGFHGPILRAAFSSHAIADGPEDLLVFACAADGSVRGWALPMAQLVYVKAGLGLCLSSEVARRDERVHLVLRTSAMKIKIFDASQPDSPAERNLGEEEMDTAAAPASLPRVSLEDSSAHLVTCAAVSMEGRVATGSESGGITIFNAATGKKLCMLFGHVSAVNCVDYALNGRRLVSASDDHTVRIWNPYRARMANPNVHKSRVVRCSLSVSQLSTSVLSLSAEGETILWNTSLAKSKALELAIGKEKLVEAMFSPSGTQIITVDTKVTMWQFDRKRLVGTGARTIPHDNVGIWCLSPCEKVCVTVETGSAVLHFWNLNATPIKFIAVVNTDHKKEVSSCVFSAGGAFLYTTGLDGIVNIWDAVDVTKRESHSSSKAINVNVAPLRSLRDPIDNGLSTCYNRLFESPDGSALLTISDSPVLKHWNLQLVLNRTMKANQCVTNIHGHANHLTTACWAPHSQLFASASSDGCIRIWDAHTLYCTHVISAHISSVVALAFLADGARIASVSVDTMCCVWSAKTGKQLNTMIFNAPISTLTVDRTGRTLVVGDSKGDVKVLELMNSAVDQHGAKHSSAASRTDDQVMEELEGNGKALPFVIPVKRVNLTVRGKQKWPERCQVRCAFCLEMFSIKGKPMEAIEEEERLRNSQGVSRLVLAERRFIVRCEFCKNLFRLTPFKVDRSSQSQLLREEDCQEDTQDVAAPNSSSALPLPFKSQRATSFLLGNDEDELEGEAGNEGEEARPDTAEGFQKKKAYRMQMAMPKQYKSFYSKTFEVFPFKSQSDLLLPPLQVDWDQDRDSEAGEEAGDDGEIQAKEAADNDSPLKRQQQRRKKKTRIDNLSRAVTPSIRPLSRMTTVSSATSLAVKSPSRGTLASVPRVPTPTAVKYNWLSTFGGDGKNNGRVFFEADSPGGRTGPQRTGDFCEMSVHDLHYLEIEGPFIKRCLTSSFGALHRSAKAEEYKVYKSTADLREPNNIYNIVHGIDLGRQVAQVKRKLGRAGVLIRPSRLDFRFLCVRCLYKMPLTLLNVSGSTVRFRAALETRPADESEDPAEVTLLQEPHSNPLVTGIASVVNVHIEARSIGFVRRSLRISTDSGELITVPIIAQVLSDADFAAARYRGEGTHPLVSVIGGDSILL